MRLYKGERVPIRILNPEERQRLFDASPEPLRHILVMALKTGMRKGEILSLKWQDVNLEHMTISVAHTKSNKLRNVPIHPELARVLQVLPRISEYVFCSSRGRKWGYNELARTAFEKARKRAGLQELTFHALRHNFASELVAKGADLRTV